jgi:S-adenosylmethionine:tRNA ribosyltransferase-isomerase
LHFTDQLLGKIEAMGVRRLTVTLNIGVGTFRPVRTIEIDDHQMHSEFVTVSAPTAQSINDAGGRIIAVGTTTVRALESAINPDINPANDTAPDSAASLHSERCRPFAGETNMFIKPGYRFRAVDALLTNFHQPKSTLLMMVSAFAGCELIQHAYREAIDNRYRFFSFGDAMLIL